MACTGIGALAAARIRLFGGVNPPSASAEQSSMRSAPPAMAAVRPLDAVDADFEDAPAHAARARPTSAAPMKAGLSPH